MKKRIIFGLTIYALMFFLGGIYIVETTRTNIHELHRLSQGHHTLLLRKDLLFNIRKNQGNIILRNRRPVPEDLSGNSEMARIVEKCVLCHTTSPTRERVAALKDEMDTYRLLTRAVFQTTPGSPLSDQRADEALKLGDALMRKAEVIIHTTSVSLEKLEIDTLRQIDRRKGSLFALVTIGPLFAVGLAFFLIRGLTTPLNSLLNATRRLKSGDLDYRVEGLRGEFGEVADSFNEMAASLKRQMLEMQRTEQLKVCGEMAAGLAHEIRNPLAGMKVAVEVLLSELTIEKQDREVLDKVIEQIRNIELLMKSFLDYARPAAPRPTHVNINKILEQPFYFITKHPSFVSANPPKQIIRELDQSLPEIAADPLQLQQVFLNMMLNAADAIPAGGTITIRTGYDARTQTVAIEFRDTGKGIPEGLLGKIFQPFFTTKGKGSGTGLGLAVSRRIVEEHGGMIEARNNVPAGAVFTVTLPIQKQNEGTA